MYVNPLCAIEKLHHRLFVLLLVIFITIDDDTFGIRRFCMCLGATPLAVPRLSFVISESRRARSVCTRRARFKFELFIPRAHECARCILLCLGQSKMQMVGECACVAPACVC